MILYINHIIRQGDESRESESREGEGKTPRTIKNTSQRRKLKDREKGYMEEAKNRWVPHGTVPRYEV